MVAPACGPSGRGVPAATKLSAGQAAAPRGNAAVQAELSEQECRAYAQSIVDVVAAGDLDGLNALVDWDAIFETALAKRGIPDKTLQEYLDGMRQGMDRENGVTGQLIDNSKRGGQLSFLRTRQRQGRPVVLIRMLKPIEQGGVNYFDFIPERSPDGRVRAREIYFYGTGEFASEMVRTILLPVIADQSRTFLAKLIIRERDYVRDFPQLGRATELMNQGKPQEALAIYKRLQPETRKHKSVLRGRLRAAQQSDDEKEYAAVLDDFRRLYPDDPCIDQISIDLFIIRRDFPAAMKAIDQLDQAVGGDPYLELTRASVREAQGDLEGLQRFALRAIEREPSLLQGHFALVEYSLRTEKFDDVVGRLKQIDQKFHFLFDDLSQVPIYAGFVKSPQYREWLDYLKSKEPTRKPAPPENGPQEDPVAAEPVQERTSLTTTPETSVRRKLRPA
jgi:hypothetical protein